jgi:hypothetical protein
MALNLPLDECIDNTYMITKKKRKRKETTKRNSNKRSKAKRKAKSKITWRRQVSDPLGKGNGSTHPRQKHAQEKSPSHQSKAQKLQRAPFAYMQAPLDECMQTTLQNRAVVSALLWRVRPVHLTSQTGGQDRPAPGNQTVRQVDDTVMQTSPLTGLLHKWMNTTHQLI